MPSPSIPAAPRQYRLTQYLNGRALPATLHDTIADAEAALLPASAYRNDPDPQTPTLTHPDGSRWGITWAAIDALQAGVRGDTWYRYPETAAARGILPVRS